MNTTLVNFLNHGLLPFVGRSAEVDRIEAFWRAAADAHGLRTFMLIGEAGAGKSRLVEEAGSLVARQRGLVVHTRLYPDSTTALAPLIARAIERAAGATGLMRSELEETLPSVAAALRRLSRLRSTIVIIEDVHLLARESLQELAVLVDNVADDSLALLCCSRTSEAPARSVLERHLVEELKIAGFDRRGLETLLMELFGRRVDRSIIDPLLVTTLGNILAVRSALRGAIRRNAIALDSHSGEWKATVPQDELEHVFAESVRMLSEGMAVHLEEAERRFAAALAPLGEIFARRTATRLVDEAMLDALVFKGILTRGTTGATLLPCTQAGGTLLAFTHTLVHNYFLEQEGGDVAALVEMVADGAPLYSAMVFRRILASRLEGISTETLDRAIARTCSIAQEINKTPDWEMSVAVLDAAERMFAACAGRLETDRAIELEADLLATRLNVLSRMRGPEFEERLERLLELTKDPTNDTLLRARLKALMHRQAWAQRAATHLFREIDDEAESLIAEHPELMLTSEYTVYLRGAIGFARAHNRWEDIRRIAARYAEIIADERTPDEVRVKSRIAESTFFVDLFSSEEELDRRLEGYEALLAAPGVDVPAMKLHRTIAWYEAGRIDDASRSLEEILPHFRDRGWRRTIAQCRIMELCIRLLRHEDPEEIEALADAILDDHPAAFRPMIATSLIAHVASAAEMAGFESLSRRLRARHRGEATTTNVLFEAVLGVLLDEDTDLSEVDLEYMRGGGNPLVFAPDPDDVEGTLEAFRAILRVPPFRLDSITLARLLFLLPAYHERRHPGLRLAVALEQEMRDHAITCIQWLMARGLWHVARVSLERFGGLIETRRRREFERAIQRLTPAPTGTMVPGSGDDRIAISMLGAIEVTRPGVETVRPKGARLRMLLGVLAADAMLEHHLSNQEFYRLAAEERDIDRARKAVYVAIHRLRDLLGAGAIVTDGETPHLELSLVRVDLVEASRMLRDAQAASLDGAWLRASTALLATLEITRGEVPFPGLYDDYFEGAREDFEGMLRSTVVRVSGALLSEGDPATAVEVLRRAIAAMPGDEDLSEILCRALVALGNRAEAERVRKEYA